MIISACNRLLVRAEVKTEIKIMMTAGSYQSSFNSCLLCRAVFMQVSLVLFTVEVDCCGRGGKGGFAEKREQIPTE